MKSLLLWKEGSLFWKNHDYVPWNYTKSTILGEHCLRSVLFYNVIEGTYWQLCQGKHVQDLDGKKRELLPSLGPSVWKSLESEMRVCAESNAPLTLKQIKHAHVHTHTHPTDWEDLYDVINSTKNIYI